MHSRAASVRTFSRSLSEERKWSGNRTDRLQPAVPPVGEVHAQGYVGKVTTAAAPPCRHRAGRSRFRPGQDLDTLSTPGDLFRFRSEAQEPMALGCCIVARVPERFSVERLSEWWVARRSRLLGRIWRCRFYTGTCWLAGGIRCWLIMCRVCDKDSYFIRMDFL